jgi:hypothetical protein
MIPSSDLCDRKSADGADPCGSRHSEKVLTRAGLTRNLGAVHLSDDDGVSEPGDCFAARVHIASHHVFAEQPTRPQSRQEPQHFGEKVG